MDVVPQSSDLLEFNPRRSRAAPELFTHAQNVQLALRRLREHQLTVGKMHRWYLMYGVPKLRARLRTVFGRWEGDVIHILSSLNAETVDDSIDGTVKGLEGPNTEAHEIIRAAVPDLFKDGAFQSAVNRSTSGSWSRLLATCLEHIHRLMHPPFYKPDTVAAESTTATSTSSVAANTPPAAPTSAPTPATAAFASSATNNTPPVAPTPASPLSVNDIRELHLWIGIMHSIIKTPAIIALFSLPVISSRLKLKLRITRERAEREEEETDLEDTSRETLTTGAQFLRNLGTLASWLAAIQYFAARPKLSNNVQFQIVRVPEPERNDTIFEQQHEETCGKIASQVHERIRDLNEDLIPEHDKTVQDVLSKLREYLPKDSSQVHCEATLMAAAAENNDQLITPWLMGEWPIGVSKKCCWTCWQLGNLIESTGTKVVLKNTHDIVYGWAPPVGLPVDILKRLRDKLLEEHITMCAHAVNSAFLRGQTVSDAHSSPEVEWAKHWE
ncbi:hypothetical protein C8F01DRAFT_1265344 [Mycena amicta]|nr:hypothetical protein C8F01DRAFT_1265344 [Mycena amicta]